MTSNRCPLTYKPLPVGRRYSSQGLQRLSRQLTDLQDLPLSALELRQEALKSASKISIQGLQPKLSAKLNIKNNCFDLVTRQGKFILKPQTSDYQQLPENEDLSMKLAESVGIQAPLHGLVRCADETFCYFIKRMDRTGHKDKIPLEDFAQLSGKSRDTKYDSSVEQIIVVIQKYCTFPALEAKHFFHRFVFNFLIGNEDMHLKNYSLITLDGVIKLAPAYDFLNTTIALANPKEETALPLNGKKRNLTAKDILSHLPFGRLSLTPKTVDDVLGQIRKSLPTWNDWIEASFLSVDLKEKYKAVVQERKSRLGF